MCIIYFGLSCFPFFLSVRGISFFFVDIDIIEDIALCSCNQHSSTFFVFSLHFCYDKICFPSVKFSVLDSSKLFDPVLGMTFLF